MSGRGRRGARPLQAVVVALLVVWLVFPILQYGSFAEDAVPMLAAGRVATGSDAKAVYERGGAFRDESCVLIPPPHDCATNGAQFVLPYISTPVALPLVVVASRLGEGPGTLLFRYVAAGSMALAMWVLWQRLRRRHEQIDAALVATIALLTPFVYVVTLFGQNAPVMFLSAALGLSATDRNRGAAGAAAAWVVQLAFKAFAAPLVLIAVYRRRWRFLAWSAGFFAVLVILAAVLLPPADWRGFLDVSRDLTDLGTTTSPWNVSVDAFTHELASAWTPQRALFYPFLVARFLALAGLFWWKLRDADEDLQWAYGWLALLLVVPQVWWHYDAVLIPAVAYMVVTRRDRSVWLLPAAAAALLPMALVNETGPLRIYGPVLLLVAAIAVPFLARVGVGRDRDASGGAPARPAPAPPG